MEMVFMVWKLYIEHVLYILAGQLRPYGQPLLSYVSLEMYENGSVVCCRGCCDSTLGMSRHQHSLLRHQLCNVLRTLQFGL